MRKRIPALRIWICLVSSLVVFPLFAQVPPVTVEKSLKISLKTPTGLAFDGKSFWAGDLAANKIARIDPETGQVVKLYDAPCFTIGALAFDGKLLWVLDSQEKAVYGFDPESGKTVKTLILDLAAPQGISFDGENIWISDGGEGVIAKIDRLDGTTFSSISSPSAKSGRRSQLIGLCHYDSCLWVADRLNDTIYQIDPEKGYIINLMKTPNPYTSGMAFYQGNLACMDYEKRCIDFVKLPESGKAVRFNPRNETLTFGESYRNFGPGSIEQLNINIAVPKNLVFQELTSEIKWDAKPASFEKDRWNQDIAVFSFRDLKPLDIASARFSVNATLYSVRFFLDPRRSGNIQDISKDLKELYLKDDTKLQITSPVIQKAVKEAVGGEKNCYYIARQIYQYIQEKMHYELSGGWNVAPVVLERGSGSCSEYSFVMIAMCRAAGLPARYAGSVVIRGDDASRDDVFHRWVEVYLPEAGWVPVDPSGGDSLVPEEQAKCFGGLENRFLITTVGGGSSEYLNWDYNSSSSYSSKGPVKLNFLKAGDWKPITAGKNEEQQGEIKKGKTCAF
jgi:hypothetical protein